MFQILPHTADIRIKAQGKDLPELFLSMAKGMMSVIKKDYQKVKPKVERKIKIGKAPDYETLLVDFLSEILRLCDTNKEVYSQVKISKPDLGGLKAKIKGDRVEGFDEDIKAVTHHDLKIKKIVKGYEAVIVFDI